jgi:hypothetical protein
LAGKWLAGGEITAGVVQAAEVVAEQGGEGMAVAVARLYVCQRLPVESFPLIELSRIFV